MTGLYDSIAAEPDGPRRLAVAHARQDVLSVLLGAMDSAGLTKAALAKRLGIGKSAVGQVLAGSGNVRVNTLAEYLYEAGMRLVVSTEPLSALREPRVRQGYKVTPVELVFADTDRVWSRVAGVKHEAGSVLMNAKIRVDPRYERLVSTAAAVEESVVSA